MREYKFRLWNGKAMSKPLFIGSNRFVYKRKGDVTMQSTGHDSIDGERVYEGDLLAFPESDQIYEVKWRDKDGCWAIMYKGTTHVGKIGLANFMQIRGNIYENPELTRE